jgi:hypothetical protein
VEAWIDSYAGSRSRPTALPAAARVGNAATVASIPPVTEVANVAKVEGGRNGHHDG